MSAVASTPVVSSFDYNEAFSRNLGWVTAEEQQRLRHLCVGIAGAGGVGGYHAEALARLGVGHFKLAELDTFELANFNRQLGATIHTIGHSKIEVIADRIRSLNPEAKIELYDKGLNPNNLIEFCQGINIYVDGLDFYQIDLRELLFPYLQKNGIPAVTAAPLGMGSSLLVFDRQSMSFDDYFGFSKCKNLDEKVLRFALGLDPVGKQLSHMADRTRLDFSNRKTPSTGMACLMCASLVGTTILKIALHRGPVAKAPVCVQYDAYNNNLSKRRVHFGYRNPIQLLKFFIAKRLFGLD